MELTERQAQDQFTNRRKMAWRSFYLLASVGIALLGFGLSSDAAAARIDALGYVITVIFGVWASVVLTYFGAASLVDWRK